MHLVLGLLSHNRKSPTTCLRISHKSEIFLWKMPIFLWWSEQNRRARAGSRSEQYNGWSQTWFLKILKVRILNFSYFLEITRTKEIFKITDRGGPPGPRTWCSVDPCWDRPMWIRLYIRGHVRTKISYESCMSNTISIEIHPMVKNANSAMFGSE